MSHRLLTRLLLAGAALALAVSGALPAAAAAAAPVVLTVSTPAAPLPAHPGHPLDTWLRLTNAGSTPLPVTIAPATVELGNNGATHLTTGIDPRFAGAISISGPDRVIPAGGYLTVPIHIAVPAGLAPDTYVLGFLVTPTVTSGSVLVVNQVGALIAIDLPGPRDRRLSASLLHGSWFAFTAHPSLTVRARDTGRSALQFTSETTIGGFGHPTPSDIRRPPLLLPAGRYRDVTVGWQTAYGIGIYHVQVLLMYHRSAAQTAQVVLTHTVVVLAPATLAALLAALAALAALVTVAARRRRHPRAIRSGRHASGRTARPVAVARYSHHR